MGKKILVVEDEKNIVDSLVFNLFKEGYETLEAYDGAAGLKLAQEQDPDLILLDLMLPEMDGFEVCRRLREGGSTVPIIMLTAREEETDKVLGLELGADDYITKPFSMRELLARVKANIRRTGMTAAPAAAGRLELGRIAVDTQAMTIAKDGVVLDLTQREYELVRVLCANKGQVLSREALMEQVWNYEGYVGDVRAVDVAVRRLREKLEDDPALELMKACAEKAKAGACAKDAFKEMLEKRTGLDVVMWDERLTTVEANRTLMEGKVRREDRSKYVDMLAAVYILQGYLDSRSFKL